MTSTPELERPDRGNQNVEHKRSRTNDRWRDSEKRHRRDVTRRTSVTDRRVQKGDHADREKKKKEMCRVQVVRHSSLIRHSTFVLRHLLSRFLDFARNDKNGVDEMTNDG